MLFTHFRRQVLSVLLLLSCGAYALAQEQPVTADFKDAPLMKVVREIESQTGLSLVLENQSGLDNDSVTLTCKEAPVQTVLKEIFGPRAAVTFKDSFVIVTLPAEDAPAPEKAAPATTEPVQGHGNTIKGRVLDEEGNPVIGAFILIKNTTKGVSADFDGNFELEVDDPSATLVVSALSYQELEILASRAASQNITLHSDNMLLDEVVVVGFGTQKKVNLTGSVATVDSKRLNARPVPSASQALQGLDPSVYITQGSGSPDAAQSITIRGAVSINSGSPLVLVDGVEMSLRYVNPNDIESISILKDASASAIYGTKASAGVVLITTKTGSKEAGKAKINFSSGVSVIQSTTSTDFITTGYDHVKLNNEFFDRFPSGNRLVFNDEEMQMLYERRNDVTENPDRPWAIAKNDGYYYYYGNFDWYSFLFNKNRIQQDYNVSVSGGTDRAKYYVAGRFYKQQGVLNQDFGEDNYHSYSLRSNVDVKITDKLRYTGNFAVADNVTVYPGGSSYATTIWCIGANLSPVFLPYNPNGTSVTRVHQLSSSNNITLHRLGALLGQSGNNRKDAARYTVKNALNYEILPGWTLTASYALTYHNSDHSFRLRNYWCGEGPEINTYIKNLSGGVADEIKENHQTTTTHTVDVFTNYSKTFGKAHNFAATAGMQYYDLRDHTLNINGTNVSDDSLTSLMNASESDGFRITQGIGTLKTLGVFARVNYDYKGRYLAEVSARGDGSSRFEKGRRWAFFPSASLGWRISEEPFFAPAKPVMSNLKLRFSSGSLGNQQMSSYYPYIEVVTAGSAVSYSLDDKQNITTASVSDPVSSGLTWETVTTNNLGVDMEFFDGRLSLTAEGYIRDTKNMLTTSITLPAVYGASTPKENCADIRTKGYEIYLTWKDNVKVGSKDLSYSITGTLGDYIAVVTRYNNPNKTLSDQYVGRVLGEIWGYHVDGLFASDEEAAEYMATIDAHSVQGNIFNSANADESYLRAGDVKYADLNGDYVISQGSNTLDDPGDRKVIGNSRPRYMYSGRFDLGWNGIDFSVYLQGIGKCDWYPTGGDNSYTFWGPYCLTPTGFIHKDFESNCWSETNTDAYFPRRRVKQAHSGSALGTTNDRYLQNVGYLRLKNINLGYTIPLKTKAIEKLRIGFCGENLWYWSPLKKYCKTVDPELAIGSDVLYSGSGIGYSYPKTYTFNLQLTF